MDLDYLAFVGLRPAAIAVALRTLGKRLKRVGLIITTAEAKKWTRALKSHVPEARDVVEMGFVGMEPLKAFCEVARLFPMEAQRLCFHVDPGFGFASARLARDLVEAKYNPIFLSAPEGELIEILPGVGTSRTPLEPLGLYKLLELYEVEPILLGISQGNLVLKIELPSGRTRQPNSGLVLDRSIERFGRFYGCKIVSKTGPAAAEAVRVVTGQRLAPSLNNLQPHVTIASDDPKVRAEAQAAGMSVCSITEVDHWAGPIETAASEFSEAEPSRIEGGGGEGDPIVLCLGRDPSAALNVIYTHRPKQALVLFDSVRQINDMADRLALRAKQLPVGVLELMPVNSRDNLPHELLARISDSGWSIHTTPGARLTVAILAGRTRNPLWSFKRMDDGVLLSKCVTGSGKREVPPVPLDVQVHVACGFHSEGSAFDATRIDVEFLRRLATHLHNARDGNGVQIESFGEGLAHYARQLRLTLSSSDRAGMSKIRFDDGTEGDVPNQRDGEWFEWMTAALVADAAKSTASNFEGRVGAIVTYPDSVCAPGRDRFESDVIVRINRDLFLFDCKSGKKPEPPQHRAVASARAAAISRFCVPVAVRPRIRAIDTAFVKPRTGATMLDLNTLRSAEGLAQRLNEFLVLRRLDPTTDDSSEISG